MHSIADGSVSIQATARSIPSTPSWFGEVVVMIEHLRKQGVLAAIGERVRFARRRFGRYEVIDWSFRALRVRYERGAYPGSVLPATPALCGPLHGTSFSVIGCPRVQRSRAF